MALKLSVVARSKDKMKSRLALSTMVVLLSLTAAGAVSAQTPYPSRPIRFIVPFPPGGGTDILSRLVAVKLTERAGWQVVVDNRSGAAGSIGLDAAAKATPDGYTMVMGQTSNLTINPSLYAKLPYDSVRDFTPISVVASSPIALMVVSKSPYKTLGDFVTAAKSKPGELTYATTGNGTVGHLSAEIFQRVAGVKLVHVPYKGSAQAFPDLLGGRVHCFLASLETAIPQMKAGQIRTLAITSAQRVPAFPDLPTVAESGHKGFETATWFGILVPKGVPQPIVSRLSAEITKALESSDVKERMAANGGATIQPGPAAFDALIRNELAKWGRVIKEAGVKVD
ncbi:MAG TPA: tripartite tricarboxylate transporter substrate binding protein [Burkholderiales bacterium]|nr:tripartite tricarboxylate transporter substrate binding protein [Burkholderiales bacterium]